MTSLSPTDQDFIALYLTNGYDELAAFDQSYAADIPITSPRDKMAYCESIFRRKAIIAELDRLRVIKERRIKWIVLDAISELDKVVLHGEDKDKLRAIKMLMDITGMSGKAGTGGVKEKANKAGEAMGELLEKASKKSKTG